MAEEANENGWKSQYWVRKSKDCAPWYFEWGIFGTGEPSGYAGMEEECWSAAHEHANAVFEAHPRTAELRAEVERWKDAERQAAAIRDDAEQQRDALQLEAERMAAAYNSASDERDALRAESERLRRRLAEAERENESWQDAHPAWIAVREERDALRAEVERLRKDVDGLHYENNGLAETVVKFRTEIDRVREHGCLGRARTGTPERQTWALVKFLDFMDREVQTVAYSHAGDWIAFSGKLDRVVEWRPVGPVPEPTEVDDG